MNHKSDSSHFLKGSVQIIRIEKTLYQEFMNCSELLGRIGQIYHNGFYLIKEDGGLTYFQESKWLRSPFGAVLDRSIGEWVKDVCLREGDVFYRRGEFLLRKKRNDCSIHINPTKIVELKRTLFPSPPERKTLLFWIQLISEKIFKCGKFEGIAGTLALLQEMLSDITLPSSVPMSIWSRHALPSIRKLIQSVPEEDLKVFNVAWESLLGLGPGLTPAGDDFLVGFLAAHKLFSSSFGKILEDYDLKRKLREKAMVSTVPIAFQFLSYALEGVFSETIYLVLRNITSHDQLKDLYLGEGNTHQIEHFLSWGHSSGTDTMTGIIFGLGTIFRAGRA